MKKGLFVVFEGPDGSSKTTQAKKLVQWLEQNGIGCIHTREPDGPIRNLLLDPSSEGKLHPCTDALLFAASRINKYKMVVEPTLATGQVVVCERYIESSIVYQGIAQGVGIDPIVVTHDLFVKDERITILLQIPVETSLERVRGRNVSLDRMEQRDVEYHRKIVDGYNALAHLFPHIKAVDATKDVDSIHAQVKEILIPHLLDRGYEIRCP